MGVEFSILFFSKLVFVLGGMAWLIMFNVVEKQMRNTKPISVVFFLNIVLIWKEIMAARFSHLWVLILLWIIQYYFSRIMLITSIPNIHFHRRWIWMKSFLWLWYSRYHQLGILTSIYWFNIIYRLLLLIYFLFPRAMSFILLFEHKGCFFFW